jgi:hypothetical protein
VLKESAAALFGAPLPRAKMAAIQSMVCGCIWKPGGQRPRRVSAWVSSCPSAPGL